MEDSSHPFELSVVSKDAFRDIFQSMSEGIIAVSREGDILVANPVAERMFGYEKNELLGKPLETLLPERYRTSHKLFRHEFNNAPVPRRMGTGRDLTAIRKDGKEIPIEISLSYSNAGGTFIAIAFISDISLRKKAEDALKQSEEQLILYATELENKVAARTEALNASITTLEREIADRKRAEDEVRRALDKERELNEMKSRFVSIASHEFRTPLSTILSSISLIDQYRQKNEAGKMEKHIERAKASVNQLIGILNDLLSLGKLDEGKTEVAIESVNLKELFSDIVEEMRLSLKEGQQITLQCDSGTETIFTDGRILRNVLFNLLSNASKYSPAGKKVTLMCEEAHDTLELRVIDDGIGIPEHDQRHLFTRFFRASNVSHVQGTGLGLNIVKRYLELLGGTISYQRGKSSGSIFIVSLPNKKS